MPHLDIENDIPGTLSPTPSESTREEDRLGEDKAGTVRCRAASGASGASGPSGLEMCVRTEAGGYDWIPLRMRF